MSLNWLLLEFYNRGHVYTALLIHGLAVWRLSYMLVSEAGPFNVFTKLRERTGIKHGDDGQVLAVPDGNVLGCIYCTSVYVAILSLIFPLWLALILAVSSVALIVHRIAGK